MISITINRYILLAPYADLAASYDATDSMKQRGWHTHLNVPVGEQVLDERPVHAGHAGVMDGEAVRQQVLELVVLDLLCFGPQHLHRGGALAQELPERVLLEAHVTDGARRLARLLARMHEHQHLVAAGVLHHLLVDDLVHHLRAQAVWRQITGMKRNWLRIRLAMAEIVGENIHANNNK
jgi:hypothetical protein